MNHSLSEDATKRDYLLPLKLDASRWVWVDGLNITLIELLLKTKYPNEKSAAKELAEEAWSRKLLPGSVFLHKGIPKRLTTVEYLNKKYAQLEAPGKCCVTINREDSMPLSDKDFDKRLSGQAIFAGVDSQGKPLFVSAKEGWCGSCEKAKFKKIVFTSSPVPHDCYNLFTGFGVKPVEGEWDKLRLHLLQVICNGDIDDYDALINLLAWQLQNIGKPSRVIVALKSQKQQTGKSIFLTKVLGAIYGEAGFITADTEKILSRFNSSLKGKAYICLEEALFSKSKKDSDTVKSIVTATEMALESKFVDSIMMPIAVNLFLATNHEACAYIEEADKRYWILDVSEHKVGDQIYFEELVREIEHGGREAFLHDLLTMDVSNFIPARDVPMDNHNKQNMIEQSISPCSSYVWLRECCATRSFLGAKHSVDNAPLEWESECSMEFAWVYDWYQAWALKNKAYHSNEPDKEKRLAQVLTAAGVIQSRTNNIRKREFPTPEVCANNLLGMLTARTIGGS